MWRGSFLHPAPVRPHPLERPAQMTTPPSDPAPDTPPGPAPERSDPAEGSPSALEGFGRWRLSLITIALTVIAFYLVPLDADHDLWWRALASGAVGAGLVVLVLRQFRLGADPIARLASLAVIVATASSASVYLLDAQAPGQFEGIATRTDALYFTVITMATIGYGDIYPVGQAARVLTTLLVVFDLVFVAALGSALGAQLRRRFPAARV